MLRCLGGTVLFLSSRPSPNSCYPFWFLALTFRINTDWLTAGFARPQGVAQLGAADDAGFLANQVARIGAGPVALGMSCITPCGL